ncbi:MAG: insulinase family protein, partial [bacterium]|nr:insulinase family protein [bacterium]
MNNIQIPLYGNPNYYAFGAPNITAPSLNAAFTPPAYGFNFPATYPSGYYFTPQNTVNTASVISSDILLQSPKGDWKLTEVEKTPYGDDIYRYELKNGQTVVLMPKKDATTIIKTFVDAGSMNENDENRGISHFNEHNVFNGSKRLEAGKFFKEVGKLGADTNASTDYAQTDFYIMSPIVDDKSLKQIIELHSDMLVNPLFPEDMVEKEKGPVTSEISMCNDDITNTA